MADRLSREQRSENMRRIKNRDTKPELVVRRLVHGLGYRYRLHRKDLPGKPDLAFGPRRKVIFVHGCFWHQHDSANCPDGRKPKSNIDYWGPKLSRNIKRDTENQKRLRELGWGVLVLWECETKNLELLKERLQGFLNSPPTEG